VAVRGWPRTLSWADFRTIQSAPAGETEEAQTEASVEPPARIQVTRAAFGLPHSISTSGSGSQARGWCAARRQTPCSLTSRDTGTSPASRATRTAVFAHQKTNWLVEDGELGPCTGAAVPVPRMTAGRRSPPRAVR
jgi:hypothetical protein